MGANTNKEAVQPINMKHIGCNIYLNSLNGNKYMKNQIMISCNEQIKQYEQYLVGVDCYHSFQQYPLCNVCGHVDYFTQYPEYILSDLYSIEFQKGLQILLRTIRGFALLYNKFGYFKVQPMMVIFNAQGFSKVWIHGDLNVTKISLNQSVYKSEDKFIREVVHIFDLMRDPNRPELSYSSILSNRIWTFVQLQQNIKYIQIKNHYKQLQSSNILNNDETLRKNKIQNTHKQSTKNSLKSHDEKYLKPEKISLKKQKNNYTKLNDLNPILVCNQDKLMYKNSSIGAKQMIKRQGSNYYRNQMPQTSTNKIIHSTEKAKLFNEYKVGQRIKISSQPCQFVEQKLMSSITSPCTQSRRNKIGSIVNNPSMFSQYNKQYLMTDKSIDKTEPILKQFIEQNSIVLMKNKVLLQNPKIKKQCFERGVKENNYKDRINVKIEKKQNRKQNKNFEQKNEIIHKKNEIIHKKNQTIDNKKNQLLVRFQQKIKSNNQINNNKKQQKNQTKKQQQEQKIIKYHHYNNNKNFINENNNNIYKQNIPQIKFIDLNYQNSLNKCKTIHSIKSIKQDQYNQKLNYYYQPSHELIQQSIVQYAIKVQKQQNL